MRAREEKKNLFCKIFSKVIEVCKISCGLSSFVTVPKINKKEQKGKKYIVCFFPSAAKKSILYEGHMVYSAYVMEKKQQNTAYTFFSCSGGL